jgi:hypothetical protein
MKKTLFILLALYISCHTVFSQVKEKATNEIKVNLLMTLFSFPDISYERVWGNNVGAGISLGFPLESSDTKFRILPYGRFYFGESLMKSFFIEGNMAIEGHKEYQLAYTSSSYYTSTTTNTNIGLGVAFGYKYINRKGLLGEIFLGLGRTFNDNYNFYPRCGISIGKVF